MSYLMSIDLGTTNLKCMIVQEDGKVLAIEKESYDISTPKFGWAEQDPNMWYEKAILSIKRAMNICNIMPNEIKAISFSGQMHGLVCIDKKGEVLYPAIIWSDQRTKQSINEIYEKLGDEFIKEHLQNRISTGFLIASLYWIYKNNLDLYEKIDKIMLPKDYIKYRLTREVVTDHSDAAGSLAYDNIKLSWAEVIIEKLGLNFEHFPKIESSTYVVGTVSNEASKETGLSTNTIIINGGSDQCMQGIGNGIIKQGIFASNIGTGGQIATIIDEPLYDKHLRTNTFAHVIPNHWCIMGACLSSGLSLKWLMKDIIRSTDYKDINQGSEKVPPGSNGLIFLPYLTGERTPHFNPNARGVFFGLTLSHDSYHLARAVMEGVVFSLKDCINVVTGLGIVCDKVIASGGGSQSRLWLQIQADILEQDIYKSKTVEQACLGAAITAGVGVGVYSNFKEACDNLVKFDDIVYHPIEKNIGIYKETYQVYKELYIANKNIFESINKLSN